MGTAVIGLVVTSTPLTLLVIRTILVVLDEARKAVCGFFCRRCTTRRYWIPWSRTALYARSVLSAGRVRGPNPALARV
jgi:hypothetical protein